MTRGRILAMVGIASAILAVIGLDMVEYRRWLASFTASLEGRREQLRADMLESEGITDGR